MRKLIVGLLFVSGIAQAAPCPPDFGGGTYVTGANNLVKVCAPDVDAAGDPVPANFYQKFELKFTWTSGGAPSASVVTEPNPVPGQVYTYNVQGAKNLGSIELSAWNTDGIINAGGPRVEKIQFRFGVPARTSLPTAN